MNEYIHSGILNGRPISVQFTQEAHHRLKKEGRPLYIGMELYFSCFIKKITNIRDEMPPYEVTQIAEDIFIYFRPVQSKSCNLQDLQGDNKPDLIEWQVKRKDDIIPRYVWVDFTKGKWQGDYTWKSGNDDIKPILLPTKTA